MSTEADANASTTAVRRMWGSELLLRKVPLYAQARHYAAVDADDPQSEANTLTYGVSGYPLLAAVRAAYDAVSSDEKITSSLRPATADLIDRSAFCDIHRAGYAHVPAQRKWLATTTAALADVTTSTPATASTAVMRRAAAAVVLDDALGPPTLAQVLEPWFGMLEDHLIMDAQAEQDEAMEKAAAKNKQQQQQQEVSSGKDGRESLSAKNKDDEATSAPRVIDAEVLRCQRRKRLHDREAETRGAVYTRVESAMMHYSVASTEEKELLRTVRVSGSGDTGEVKSAAEPSASLVSTGGSGGTSADTWGSRMLSLVTAAVANERGPLNDEKAEQQQKVLAYLKRVRWISSQWGSRGAAATVRDAAAAPLWSQLTEAARVQTEMAHTQGQRRRFRRTRHASTSGAAKTDDGDAADE